MRESKTMPQDADEVSKIPLSQIDVSDSKLYQQDTWRPYFKRLRDEAPVHYLGDSPLGPFWSVTRFEDIVIQFRRTRPARELFKVSIFFQRHTTRACHC